MPSPTSTEPPTLVLIRLADIIDGPADKQRLTRDDDRIAELAQSIERHGILTPLLLRKTPAGYETVAGGYRRDAARLIDLTEVPAILVDGDDASTWDVSTTENLQRQNLSALEEAEIVRIDHVDHGRTLQQIAHAHGHSIAWVEDRLNMLTWDPVLLHAIHHGKLSKAAAAPIASIDNTELRARLTEEAIRYGATARVTANWARTAQLVAQNPNETDIQRITEAPTPTPQRLICQCWMCRNELEIANVSHLPTCPLCVEVVRQNQRGVTPTLQADSPATA